MSTPIEVVQKVLENATTEPEVVENLCTPDMTYISLCYSNPALHSIMAHAGLQEKAGPQAVIFTFANVNRIWANEDFQILSIFSAPTQGKEREGESDVAVFGKFTYRSRTLGKVYESPMSMWCKVVDTTPGKEGGLRMSFMQFMEDTFGTGAVFRKSESAGTYVTDPESMEEFEVRG